jgi:carboxyl-terminal processing protease
MLDFFKTRGSIGVILLVAFFFFFGIFIGVNNKTEIEKVVSLSNKENSVVSQTDFSPFWKAWNTLDEKAQNASEASTQDRVYGAIQGLVSSLDDPYSVFFPPDEAKAFSEEIAGNFTGVGMEVGVKNKILTVIAPLKDTPAERAGIMTGDQILKIDKTLTTGMGSDEAIKLIRGEKGTTVVLTIFREGLKEPKEIKIVRDIINVPTLDTEVRPDGIFVIKLYSFSANSAGLFNQAMQKFMESGSNKLILDLRGNPGGYLDSAVDIASWFLEGGKTVVTEDYGKSQKPKVFRSRGYNIYTDKLKFVVLINGGSASASEIVAGALQDNGKAKLVGEQSFGKGSVQEVINLTKDTLLKITVAKWLTPNGNMIHGKGLTPDYKVELNRKDLDNQKDPQMDKAIELLNN